MSVRFLGWRVYLVLRWCWVCSACRAEPRGGETFDDAGDSAADPGTLARMVEDQFPRSTLWQAAGARFMPPITDRFPTSLLECFVGDTAVAMGHLLLFLTPITVRPTALRGGR